MALDDQPSLDAELIGAARLLWTFHGVETPLQPCDVLVGLGSYDVRVAERVADLYFAGIANRVVVTGGYGNWTKGVFKEPEALVFARIIASRGVPDDAVTVEIESTNIGENIRNTQRLLADVPVRRVTLVTKPQTRRRAYATAVKQWAGVEVQVACPLTSFDAQPTKDHSLADLINELVGDLVRLKRYPALGWQSEQVIPDHVSAAADRLIRAGFVAHLPG